MKFAGKLVTLASALALGGVACAQDDVVTVEMNTEAGAITIELYPRKAPVTVANFLHFMACSNAGCSFPEL